MVELRVTDEPICDFCSHPNPTRTYRCPDFPMDESPGFPVLGSKGDWKACSTCGEFIDSGRWASLLLRSIDKLKPKYDGMIPVRLLVDTIRRSHNLFRQHYVPPKPV